MTHPSQLAAKVAARNAVNALAALAAPAYLAAILPFVGRKIVKATGDFTKEFAAALPSGFEGYWNSKNYSLSRVFKVSKQGPRTCVYQETSVYFGEMEHNSGVLAKVLDFHPEHYRTDFTVAEILAAREEVTVARKAFQTAESKLSHFGEHDNN